MRYLLSIEASGASPAEVIHEVRVTLSRAIRDGQAREAVTGTAKAHAAAVWRCLTCVDEGDDTTELRVIGRDDGCGLGCGLAAPNTTQSDASDASHGTQTSTDSSVATT